MLDSSSAVTAPVGARLAPLSLGVSGPRMRPAGLAGGAPLPDIFCHRPGVEVDFGFGAEGILPGHGGVCELRLLHGHKHVGRNRTFEKLLRRGRIVANVAPGAGLVLRSEERRV